jgi:Cu/Ag efflux protein CusF
MADTAHVTAKVKAVDLDQHKVTLEFSDGRTKTVAVRPDVKLSLIDIGREVDIQVTQAVALRVERP